MSELDTLNLARSFVPVAVAVSATRARPTRLRKLRRGRQGRGYSGAYRPNVPAEGNRP